MTLQPADIVQCSKGRFKSSLFLVLSVDGTRALLADGKHHTLEKPKKKNLKHISFFARLDETDSGMLSSDKITNKQLRKTMAAFAARTIEDHGGASVG